MISFLDRCIFSVCLEFDGGRRLTHGASSPRPIRRMYNACAEEISKLHERLNGLVFSNQEDGSGEYGEKTWQHAFAMVEEAVGCGYALQMNKKSKVSYRPAFCETLAVYPSPS